MLFILAAIPWTTLLPAIGVFLGPIFTYFIAARRFSGKIGTSDAAALWEESGKLRSEYKNEMNELRAIVTKLRDRVFDLEEKNEILHLENGELRKEVTRLRAENKLLKARVSELEREKHARES